jgi:hypothetical protein
LAEANRYLIVLLLSALARSTDTDASTFVFEGPKGVTTQEVFALLAPGIH